jgi:hypothetical protein
VPGRHADLDRAERRQVGAGVNVDGLQLTDLVTLRVNHIVAAPLPDVGSLEHAALLPRCTTPHGGNGSREFGVPATIGDPLLGTG